jgi:hypothetical protein
MICPLPEWSAGDMNALLPLRLTLLASEDRNELWLVWSRAEPHPRWFAVMESSRSRADAGLPATAGNHKIQCRLNQPDR